MSTAAGSLGYQRGAGVESTIWAPLAGFLVLAVSAALVVALFTAPAQPPGSVNRGVPIGRVAPAPRPQAIELGAVLSQGPAFTGAADRAVNRSQAAQLGAAVWQGREFTAAADRAVARERLSR